MDKCEFMFYKPEEENFSCPYLYCKLDDNRCIYSRRCLKVSKFIPNDDLWKECFKMVEEKKKHIPKDSYYVECTRPNKHNKLFLYVVVDDKVEKVLTDLEKIDQNYVYLKNVDGKYMVSLTPFPKEEPKKVVIDEPVDEKPKKRQPKRKVEDVEEDIY